MNLPTSKDPAMRNFCRNRERASALWRFLEVSKFRERGISRGVFSKAGAFGHRKKEYCHDDHPFRSACSGRGGCACAGPDRGTGDRRADRCRADISGRDDAEFKSLHTRARHQFARRSRAGHRQSVSAGIAADADTELSARRDVCCASGNGAHTPNCADIVATAALCAQRDEGMPKLGGDNET